MMTITYKLETNTSKENSSSPANAPLKSFPGNGDQPKL